ncbi:MAG TPA: hypothetical protein VEZ50_14295 [Nodosilinea sp.]|nr:hypothetical protein [Nodosilinea sp.]
MARKVDNLRAVIEQRLLQICCPNGELGDHLKAIAVLRSLNRFFYPPYLGI